MEPEILLMDEPFGALDTHTKLEMHKTLLEIWERERQTVLFVTHDLGEALTLASRIILLSARPGRLKEDFEVALPAPARRGRLARDAGVRAALLAHLALARRRVPADQGRMSARSERLANLAWQIAILAAILAVWEWGFELRKLPALKPFVPTILDPYFVSKPSAIWASFLKLGCFQAKDGIKACLDANANNLWIATLVTVKNTFWGFLVGSASGMLPGSFSGARTVWHASSSPSSSRRTPSPASRSCRSSS